MAGHSKWATTKHKKAAIDAARSKVFQKLAVELFVAAKGGDKDPKNNPTLRMVIDKAKGANMPGDKIKAAIDKASGDNNGENFDSVRYEGYGPGGIAVIVDCLTDNRNRTAPQVRSAFSKSGGNLGTDGSVSYMFSRKGVIIIPNSYNEEEIMMNALDNGALDIVTMDDVYEIYTTPDNFIKVKDGLDLLGITDYMMSEVTFIADNFIDVPSDIKEKVEKLIETLEDIDDVQDVYHNMNE